ncbi:uncharacterized protein [Pseudorasbora parva]|uniref:uncharacterized protein isoform X2 n=1 Tax=Pseudorasbora parva TaxID=51549 RepID=UPI00351DDFD3
MQNMILLFLCLLMDGVFGSETNETKAVMEGDSVTLHTNLTEIQNNDRIMWMFGPKDSVLMQTTRMDDLTSFFVNDDSGFRGRLQVDQKTGSLTIRNARIRHSGQYKLTISRENTTTKIFNVTVYGVSGADTDEVSLMEGDSVILNTDLKTDQQDRIRWYFNEIRMALISGDQSKICADDQCKERFRDRLKLDHQTGSLTIMNIKSSDTGLYEVQFNSGNIVKVFNVTVHDVPAAERDEVKRKSVMEGESVTLDPNVIKTPVDLMEWHFNNTFIAKITGDQSQICTDDQCKERFRDRLKLDHQTGSLTITHTTNTDSGLYQLEIKSVRRRHRRSIAITTVKSFSVSVSAVPDLALSSGAEAGLSTAVVVGALLIADLLSQALS